MENTAKLDEKALKRKQGSWHLPALVGHAPRGEEGEGAASVRNHHKRRDGKENSEGKDASKDLTEPRVPGLPSVETVRRTSSGPRALPKDGQLETPRGRTPEAMNESPRVIYLTFLKSVETVEEVPLVEEELEEELEDEGEVLEEEEVVLGAAPLFL